MHGKICLYIYKYLIDLTLKDVRSKAKQCGDQCPPLHWQKSVSHLMAISTSCLLFSSR